MTKTEVIQHVDDPCTACGQPLARIPWNTACDILLCDNANCHRFREPQGSIHTVRTPGELDAENQILYKDSDSEYDYEEPERESYTEE